MVRKINNLIIFFFQKSKYFFVIKLTVEAHVRIPTKSSLSGTATFKIAGFSNGIYSSSLTMSVSGSISSTAPAVSLVNQVCTSF